MNGIQAIEAHDSSCPADEAWTAEKDINSKNGYVSDPQGGDIVSIIVYAVLFILSIVAIIHFCIK